MNPQKTPVQIRSKLIDPNTAQIVPCCETERWNPDSSLRLEACPHELGVSTSQPIALIALTKSRCAMFAFLIFGALGAKRSDHASSAVDGESRAPESWSDIPFGWPVGSVTTIASVVDLPLATPAAQNVFGASQTPVFISWCNWPRWPIAYPIAWVWASRYAPSVSTVNFV